MRSAKASSVGCEVARAEPMLVIKLGSLYESLKKSRNLRQHGKRLSITLQTIRYCLQRQEMLLTPTAAGTDSQKQLETLGRQCAHFFAP